MYRKDKSVVMKQLYMVWIKYINYLCGLYVFSVSLWIEKWSQSDG